MGVHGLWDLLAPVGRRVSVETLAGKKLAIDASIWMIQFMKAMRDEKGEMVRNAHLLGFFRRICKLLYLRCKPIFVFDGATPALKRRTVIARRRQRENAQAKIRKTAEKLLLNHLKSMRLKELAKDFENQGKKQKSDDAKGKKILSDQTNGEEGKTENNYDGVKTYDRELLDEMLAASIAAEEDENSNNKAYSSAAGMEEQEYDDENEEMILPAGDDNVDPAVLASLPSSMQLDLLMKERLTSKSRKHNQVVSKDNGNQKKDHKSTAKGGKILIDLSDIERDNLEGDNLGAESYNQQKIDEMLAASIAAEESESLTKTASTSAAAAILSEEKGSDEDEEMILPAMCGKVDPAVLAALPPSMQLDLLVQMRERLMAENRQKYQKVKKAPEKFSELQIEAYLKTVAFRREIDQVQKAAAGNDVGGVQSSRIASEANREFIFSSSFMGDKQLLTTTGVQKNGNKQQIPIRNPSSEFVNCVASTGKSDAVTGLVQDESRRVFDEDIETFFDEMGRIRVSRVRAMGMRLTRDLQRNLDLMKEIEEERTCATKTASGPSELDRDKIGSPKSIPSNKLHVTSSHDKDLDSTKLNERNRYSFSNNEDSMQISFEVDDRSKNLESDDDMFTALVARQPFKIHLADDRQASESVSDSDWDEGIIERRDNSPSNDLALEVNPPPKDSYIGDDDEVEWQDGSDNHEKSLPSEARKPASRGYMEEEADLQEAIRRSLEDIGGEKLNNSSSDLGKLKTSEEHGHLKLSEAHDSDNMSILERDVGSNDGQQNQTVNFGVSIHREIPSAESAAPLGAKEAHVIMERSSDTVVEAMGISASANPHLGGSDFSEVVYGKAFATPLDDEENKSKAGPFLFVNEEKKTESNPLTSVIEPSIGLTFVADVEPNLDGEKNSNYQFDEQAQELDKFMSNEDLAADFSEATLQDEILILGQESKNLESVQKKLERNAESVSSEMFAECQELLQIFGLPYIIAPMEAEAQCAYMELANLVDGVVTDDSDVFLFGARNVYKNIFDDRKYVETYFMKDVEKELGLTREQLVRMALLLGSDYTEGISGIGIVNAIEVLNAFPEEDGLEKFREWIESPDPTILKSFEVHGGMGMRNQGNSNSAHDNIGDDSFVQDISGAHKKECSPDHIQEIRQDFMHKHRNVSKNWHVPSSFPNEAVISAYLCPQVDKSTEPFTWGKPDLHVLRRLCWERFAWNIQKSDELLLPVLKEYNKHETQLRLEAFYTFNERFAKIRSKRIKKALKGITGHQSLELTEDDKLESSKIRKKITHGPGGTCESSVKTDSSSFEKSTTKRSRKRTNREPVLADVENLGHQGLAKGRRNTHDGQSGDGSRRGHGRGNRCIKPKGRRKGSEIELSDSSHDHDSSAEDEMEVCVGKSEGLQEARRSMRPRKAVNYAADDSEVDVDRSPEHGDKWSNGERLKRSSITVERETRDACTAFSSQEQHKMDNPFPDDTSKIHLEMGDGFTIDGIGSGKAGGSQNSHPSFDDMPKEYFKSGGGFCIDESETFTNEESLAMPASGEAADISNLSEAAEEDVRGKNLVPSISSVKRTLNDSQDTEPSMDRVNARDADDCSKVDSSPLESTRSKLVEPRLSAMPYLKRKRRKK